MRDTEKSWRIWMRVRLKLWKECLFSTRITVGRTFPKRRAFAMKQNCLDIWCEETARTVAVHEWKINRRRGLCLVWYTSWCVCVYSSIGTFDLVSSIDPNWEWAGADNAVHHPGGAELTGAPSISPQIYFVVFGQSHKQLATVKCESYPICSLKVMLVYLSGNRSYQLGSLTVQWQWNEAVTVITTFR